MKIKLAEGIIEKSNGEMHWHSKDQPFDVDARVGKEMIASGDFEEYVSPQEEKPKKEAKEKK